MRSSAMEGNAGKHLTQLKPSVISDLGEEWCFGIALIRSEGF